MQSIPCTGSFIGGDRCPVGALSTSLYVDFIWIAFTCAYVYEAFPELISIWLLKWLSISWFSLYSLPYQFSFPYLILQYQSLCCFSISIYVISLPSEILPFPHNPSYPTTVYTQIIRYLSKAWKLSSTYKRTQFYICLLVVSCVSVQYTYAWCLWRPDETIITLGTRGRDNGDLPRRCWESNLDLLKE